MFETQSLGIITAARRQDLNREAEMERLVRQARAAHDSADPFYAQALAALGRRLSNWGEQLQERYSQGDTAPMTFAADEAGR